METIWTKMRWAVVLPGSLLGVGGCAGQDLGRGLEAGWNYDGGVEARSWLGRLPTKAEVDERAPSVAIGVVRDGLVGRELPLGPPWKREAALEALPVLDGGVVGYSEAETLTLLDARSGTALWSVPSSGRLLEGMSDDGEATAVLLVDRHDARPDVVAVVDRNGRERFRRSTTEVLGTPALVGGVLLVPWGRQYVSAYDSRTGESFGRLLLRDALGAVLTFDGVPYAAGRGLSRLGPESAASPEPRSLTLPRVDMPGEPRWPTDGTLPRKLERRSVALLASPEPSGRGFASGVFVATYYSMVMGLDTARGDLRWVNWLPRTTIGSSASSRGVALCAEDGSVLDVRFEDGLLVPRGSLETRLSACVVSPPAARPSGAARPGLDTQVADVLEHTYADMETAKAFVLRSLRALPKPEVTALFLRVASDPLRSAELRREATLGLETRADSPELFAAALEQALERARGEKAPNLPLAVLARAVGRLNVRTSAPILASFLTLPLLPDDDAAEVMRALTVLGGPSEVPDVLTFLATFRTTGGSDALRSALVNAALFVQTHGTADDLGKVRAALDEPGTLPSVREDVTRALDRAARPKEE